MQLQVEDGKPSASDENLPRVYLAGPITGAADGGTHWREWFTQAYDGLLECLNPLNKYDGQHLTFISDCDTELSSTIAMDNARHFRGGREEVTISKVVETDKEMIDESDAVIAYHIPGVQSVGTAQEIIYAHDRGIPVATVVQLPLDTRLPIWLEYHSDIVTTDFDHAVSHLMSNSWWSA